MPLINTVKFEFVALGFSSLCVNVYVFCVHVYVCAKMCICVFCVNVYRVEVDTRYLPTAVLPILSFETLSL